MATGGSRGHRLVSPVLEGILEEVSLGLRREDSTGFSAVEQEEFQVREVGVERMLWGVKGRETCIATLSVFCYKPPQTTASLFLLMPSL